LSIESPVDCLDPCASPLISIGGSICSTDIAEQYEVNYTLIPGAILTVNAGSVVDGKVVSIPGNIDLIITVHFEGCDDDVIEIPSKACLLDTDKDGVADIYDLDDDNDGILDTVENATASNGGDTDGDGIPDSLDLDSDNDGILDIEESSHGGTDIDGDGRVDGPYGDNGFADELEEGDDTGNALNTPVDTDGDGVPDFQDVDSDNDGVSDLVEGGSDPALDNDGDGMIDPTVPDVDGNGIPDVVDPNISGSTPAPTPDTDGDGIDDYRDLDSDNDGINDIEESGSTDTNGDGLIDEPNTLIDGNKLPDTDGNGIVDILEPNNPGLGDLDSDGDGVIDDTSDIDGDGIPDVVDGAKDIFGDSRKDSDGDGVADIYDLDDDNDGILDTVENATASNGGDTDGDGIPDSLDLDSDNDGILDIEESGHGGIDADGDGRVDGSYGDNGFADELEEGDETGNPLSIPLDTDGDGIPNFQDVDDDGDGVLTSTEIIEDTDYLDMCSLQLSSQTLPTSVQWKLGDCDGDSLTNGYELDRDDDGVPDDFDGDGISDVFDTDDDNDGVPTIVELAEKTNPFDKDKFVDSDEDGIPDYVEVVNDYSTSDADGDGILDSEETPSNPYADNDNDGIPAYLDDNDDDDTIGNDDDAVEPEFDVDNDGEAEFQSPFVASVIINANDDKYTVASGEKTVLSILDNDDFESGYDKIEIISNPSNGTAEIDSDGKLIYTSNLDFGGVDTIEYRICDLNGCSTAIVTITVDLLNIPTGFSPNGDGFNDTFFIKGLSQYPNNKLKLSLNRLITIIVGMVSQRIN